MIRPGSGYLDRANDLMGLADIYRDRPREVRLDGKLFKETDEADARKLASQIFEQMGLGEQIEGINWYDEQHRSWVHMDTIYADVARWGRALDADASPNTLYPDLRGASRAPWGSVTRDEPAAPPVVLPP